MVDQSTGGKEKGETSREEKAADNSSSRNSNHFSPSEFGIFLCPSSSSLHDPGKIPVVRIEITLPTDFAGNAFSRSYCLVCSLIVFLFKHLSSHSSYYTLR